jgi:hypothetical protein
VDPELAQEAERARFTSAPPAATRERERAERLAQSASALGNRGFGQLVARMRDGEGILPSGVVHPDVEAAIAASQGGGRSLDGGIGRSVGAMLGESFADVRVHTDDNAAALARAVSARAFTVGSDIYFAAGEYRPGTPAGGELITHELAHVVQQRGVPQSGPLVVSQPGDAMEREAEALVGGSGA